MRLTNKIHLQVDLSLVEVTHDQIWRLHLKNKVQ